METVVEQRQSERTKMTWPISVWLPTANRFFNGRTSNISKTGVFLSLPMTTPVKDGDEVELNFPRTRSLAEEKGCYARIKSGTVVRVERRNMMKSGMVGVAIAFE